jgi:hypothetical protein
LSGARRLALRAGRLAICRAEPGAPPPWLPPEPPISACLWSDDGMTVVCREDAVPVGVRAERGRRALTVEGPLDPSLTGVIASLTAPLAAADVPVFVLSTFETDHLLVAEELAGRAAAALRDAGHAVDGCVEAVFTAARGTERPDPVTEVEAVPGRGLAGDRYFSGEGTFWRQGKPGQDLTLVEAEAIEALASEHGVAIAPEEARRNVLTRGADLNSLVGRTFFVGEVECRGDRLCDPCSHLERLTKPGTLRGLAGRGGLRADIVSPGRIRPGDRLRVA